MPPFCVCETRYDTDDSCEVHELEIVREKKNQLNHHEIDKNFLKLLFDRVRFQH